MDTAAWITLLLAGILLSSTGIYFSLTSFSRHENRAGWAGLAGAAFGLIILAAAFFPWQGKIYLAGFLILAAAGTGVLLALPVGRAELTGQRPSRRVDERTIMFSRNRLQPDTPQYGSYYASHPEHKDLDDEIRKLPGLLSPQAPMAEPKAFAAADAGFFLTESLRDAVDGPVASCKQVLSPDSAASYLKNLGRYFGASNAGICEIRDYHIYSHVGRGSGTYGDEIVLDHSHVIVFSFEMAEEMVRTAPGAEEVMETARQYSEAAQAAVQVAAWIRLMGYEARAHIDGNYRLILPLAGRDAGLGEIGRMGLLMTPELGPRIRLSAVSTTLPLACDLPGDDPSLLDFCSICQKCAENCPGQAIPFQERQWIDGALRWKINAEQCFKYWNIIGTDCGRCMMVCPYSHARDPVHNMVRWAVGRSGAARRLALRMDDWVYGRKPKPRPAPEWTRMM